MTKGLFFLKKLEMIRSLWALTGGFTLGVIWFLLHVISIALARWWKITLGWGEGRLELESPGRKQLPSVETPEGFCWDISSKMDVRKGKEVQARAQPGLPLPGKWRPGRGPVPDTHVSVSNGNPGGRGRSAGKSQRRCQDWAPVSYAAGVLMREF